MSLWHSAVGLTNPALATCLFCVSICLPVEKKSSYDICLAVPLHGKWLCEQCELRIHLVKKALKLSNKNIYIYFLISKGFNTALCVCCQELVLFVHMCPYGVL